MQRNHRVRSTTLVWSGALILAAAAAPSQAAIFSTPSNQLTDPAITASQTPFSPSYVAANVFDGIFGTGSGEYSTTNAVSGDAFIDFDFGSPQVVGGFVFYQRLGGADGVTNFQLIFDDTNDFSSPLATKTLSTLKAGFVSSAQTSLETARRFGSTAALPVRGRSRVLRRHEPSQASLDEPRGTIAFSPGISQRPGVLEKVMPGSSRFTGPKAVSSVTPDGGIRLCAGSARPRATSSRSNSPSCEYHIEYRESDVRTW